MEGQKKNMDDLFREALSGYREAPPEAAWQQVASRLEALESGRRTRRRWPWIVLMLACMLAGGWWALDLRSMDAASSADGGIAPQASMAIQTVPINVSADRMSQSRSAAEQTPIKSVKQTPQSAGDRVGATIASNSSNVAVKGIQTATIPAVTTSEDLRALQPIARLHVKPFTPFSKGNTNDRPTVESSENPVRYAQRLDQAMWSPRIMSPVAASMRAASGTTPAVLHSRPVQSMFSSTPWLAARSFSPITTSENSNPPASVSARPIAYSARLPKNEMEAVAPETKQPVFKQSTSSIAAVKHTSDAPSDAEITTASSEAINTSSKKNPANDGPLKLRRPTYEKVFSAAAFVGISGSSSVQGYYDAGLRLMMQLSGRLGVGIQPSFGYGNARTVEIKPGSAYYRSSVAVDSFRTLEASPSVRHAMDTIYNYVVHEQYDSIAVAALMAGGGFWEISLPILVRYAVTDHVYAYGGPSLQLAGRLTVKQPAITVQSQQRKDSIAQSQMIPSEDFQHYFGTPNLPEYGKYEPATSSLQPGLHIGYIFGIGYERNRFSAELKVQQQLSGFQSLPEPVRSVFAQPRVGLSVGYRLFQSHKKDIVPLQ